MALPVDVPSLLRVTRLWNVRFVLLQGCVGMSHSWLEFAPGVQMAARETGFGAVEQYMHAGKLLALELLVRVLENPHHHWSALRPEVWEALYPRTSSSWTSS